ncbi:hypothetical protein G3R49_07925 [Shewanella sp. WXL01]|uniref:Outer membrane protein beta-barrel domain-containing protein n=1 Tax=Shewanella maritima TaxID=2520507 RepID=A0A411PDQ1_9GAMM|nr:MULTISPECIES: hypothetical protein [Shewanella]NKF50498.1 hypothetical protein [Shewanella sp. WXL01]QBF81500.1 hypothetical protein EXU30_01395 [Shewanella maritima]
MFKSALACSLLLAMSPIAVADVTAEDSFAFRVGAFYASSDSYMNVTNPETGGIFPLDFEDDLFLAEDQFLPFFEFVWSFNDRHHVYVDWKSLHRTANTPYVEDTWIFTNPNDDKTYIVEAGAQLKTTLNIDIMRLGYGYDLFQGDDYTFGASIGLHTMFIKTAFEGTIGLCSPTVMANSACNDFVANPRVVDESLTAPLPDIGIYGTYEFIPGWTIGGHAQYFAIKYDDVKGSLIDIRASVETNVGDNWQLSVGYNYYEVDVDYAQNVSFGDQDFHLADYNLNYSFTGPRFSVQYHF